MSLSSGIHTARSLKNRTIPIKYFRLTNCGGRAKQRGEGWKQGRGGGGEAGTVWALGALSPLGARTHSPDTSFSFLGEGS